MNFDDAFYVPVLRWKQGEKSAMKWMSDSSKARTMPLIELIPKNFKKPDGKKENTKKAIQKIVDEIDEYWGTKPAFIDFAHVIDAEIKGHKNESHMLEVFFKCINTLRPLLPSKPPLVPVLRLKDKAMFHRALRSVIEQNEVGACLRVSLDEVMGVSFATSLERTLTRIGLEVQDCDLMIDLKFISTNIPPLLTILNAVPHLTKWNSLTLLAGSFPADLQEYEKDDVHNITREEWFYFREQTQLLSKDVRWPVYGDNTVQHAIYKEPPDHCNPSSSIRYTHEDYWVIMRGHGLTHKGSLKNDQYPAEAQLLCGKDEFCGADFSNGDKYIAESWKNGKNGNPTTWIRAGINHHIEFVASQILKYAKTSTRRRRRA